VLSKCLLLLLFSGLSLANLNKDFAAVLNGQEPLTAEHFNAMYS